MSVTAPVPPVVQALCARDQLSLECYLGSGASKAAYKVAIGSGQAFALKVAPVSGIGVDRLAREVGALRACNHRHIAQLVHAEIFSHTGHDYVVMVEEFLDGGTLEALLTSGPMPSADVKALAVPLADAVAHLESLGLVHRDIKPANILFRAPNEPVLTDFGIVRQLGVVSLTADFLPRGPGTPLYSSPEQLSNDKAAIDWRSDQFGLALVLAECVLGAPPFQPTPGDLHGAVLTVAGHGLLPRTTQDKLLQLGWGCLVKALAPWPVQRYRTPTDLCNAIGAV